MEDNKAKVIVNCHLPSKKSPESSPEDCSRNVKRVENDQTEENDCIRIVEDNSKKRGTVKCAKCNNHGIVAHRKGHKGNCRYENCNCPKCTLINERREVLRLQVMNQRLSKRNAKQLVQTNHGYNTTAGRAQATVKRQLHQHFGTSNVIGSNEVVQSQPLKFHHIAKSYKDLSNYLSATAPLREDVYKFAILHLCDNNPVAAFQHLMRTNARLNFVFKMSTTPNMQESAPKTSFAPTANSLMVRSETSSAFPASGIYHSPLPGHVTLLPQNNPITPYLPSVTTFLRSDTATTNTFSHTIPSMVFQKSLFGGNVVHDMESNSE